MTIAIVTYALNVGGMETALLSLAEGLRRIGHEPHFVITESVGPWQERARVAGFPVHTVLARLGGFTRRQYVRKLTALLSRFDAVLLNHTRAGQSAAIQLPADTVVVSVLHNDDPYIYDLGLAHAGSLNAVVAVSPKVHAEAIRRLDSMTQKPQVVLIPYGVELPVAQKISQPDEPLRVIVIGRIEDGQKNILAVPRIIELAVRRGATLTCDIVGDGADMARLRSAIAAHGVEAHVQLHGSKPHDESLRMLERSDVLLLPSHFEGLPLVLLEAIVRGVVPVASRLAGITDYVIDDGVTGSLHAPADTEAFGNALAQLHADRERLTRMSTAARLSASGRFGVNDMCRAYASLLLACDGQRVTGRLSGDGGDGQLLLTRGDMLPALLRAVVKRFRRPKPPSAGAAQRKADS